MAMTESYTAAKGGIAASCRTCRKPNGHSEYGSVSVFGQGGIYHRRKHLYRWGNDQADDLS